MYIFSTLPGDMLWIGLCLIENVLSNDQHGLFAEMTILSFADSKLASLHISTRTYPILIR